MKTEAFAFHVPPSSIATFPVDPPSASRCLVFDRSKEQITHIQFLDLPGVLDARDLLVFNQTKVLKARFRARRKSGAELEGLLLPSRVDRVRAWIKGKVSVGEIVQVLGFGDIQVLEKSGREVILGCSLVDFVMALQDQGEIPIPPYIVQERERRGEIVDTARDLARYQSFFAQSSDLFSSAAPTASFHFDEKLLKKLDERGVSRSFLKLHVGAATFSPIDVEEIGAHQIAEEFVEIPETLLKQCEQTKQKGGRVIAVGTTVMRALESAVRRPDDMFFASDLYIHPPFEFKIVDGLITNFHWEKSSLLVLVATFLEAQKTEGHSRQAPSELRGLWRKLYEEALKESYRFYSFGDGMVVL